jgi:hypothetical protein
VYSLKTSASPRISSWAICPKRIKPFGSRLAQSVTSSVLFFTVGLDFAQISKRPQHSATKPQVSLALKNRQASAMWVRKQLSNIPQRIKKVCRIQSGWQRYLTRAPNVTAARCRTLDIASRAVPVGDGFGPLRETVPVFAEDHW